MKCQATLTIGGATFEVYAHREVADHEIWRAVSDYVSQHETAAGSTYFVVVRDDSGK